MIQAHYIYWALYLCYYISYTSDNQALDSAGWGPCLKLLVLSNYPEASVGLFMARERIKSPIYVSYKQCAPCGPTSSPLFPKEWNKS